MLGRTSAGLTMVLWLVLAVVPAHGQTDAGETDPIDDPFLEAQGDPFGDLADDPFGDEAVVEGEGDDHWEAHAAGTPWDEAAAGKKVSFGGRLFNKIAVDTKEDNPFEDLYQNQFQLQLDALYRPTRAVEVKMSAGADYFAYGQDSDWDNDANLRLFDAYVNLAADRFNLKLGNQIVRWGKTDGFSPLDNLNPEDFRGGIGGRREDRKMQIPMVNLELYPGLVTLQGIYIPWFIKSKYDSTQTDWALFDHYPEQVGGFTVNEEDPANTFENSEAGVRLAGTAGRVDFEMSYFYSHERVGTFDSFVVPPGFTAVLSSRAVQDLARFARETGQEIRLLHDRQQIYGLAFETTLAAFGLRGDLVYTDRVSYLNDELQRVRKPLIQYLVGADYNGPEGFYLNVQFGQAFIQDYEESILLTPRRASNVNGTVSKELVNGDLKLEFRWFYDLDGDGTLYNPKCILNFWRNVTVELGVEVFDGTDAHPLGFYRDNDQAYALLEWRF